MPIMQQNWLSTEDIAALLRLADFDVIKREWRQLVPKRLLGNRHAGEPLHRALAAHPPRRACATTSWPGSFPAPRRPRSPSITVLGAVPQRARQHRARGPAPAALRRRHGDPLRRGPSKDGTLDEINRVIAAYPQYDIKVMVQPGKGKGDAGTRGLQRRSRRHPHDPRCRPHRPPEWMPKFYQAHRARAGRVHQRHAPGLSDGETRRCSS
jgi:hypothetical protein